MNIKKIKKFFKNKKFFNLSENIQYNKENKIWQSIIQLYYKDYLVLEQYGIGLTKKESLIKGYYEIFERYCLNINLYLNSIFYSRLNLSQNLTFEQIQSNLIFSNFLQLLNINDQLSFQELIDPAMHGVAYTNLNNKLDKQNYSIPLLLTMNFTTGLASGNSLTQALVNGLNELCERYALSLIFYNPNLQYYEINLHQFNSIINKFPAINKSNLKIFDLYLTFQLPVFLIVYFDNDNTRIIYTCVASWDIKTAIKKGLSELSIKYNQTRIKLQIPFLQQNIKDMNTLINNAMHSPYEANSFPEQIFLNSKQINKIYLPINNNQALEQYKELFNKLHKQFYYIICSPINSLSLYTVHIFSPDIIISYPELLQIKQYQEIKKEINNITNKILNDKIELSDFNNIINFINNQPNQQLILQYDPMVLSIHSYSTIKLIYEILTGCNFNNSQSLKLCPFYKNIINYLLLKYLCLDDKYSQEDIFNIFKQFNISINTSDINSIKQDKYLDILNKYIFTEIKQQYQIFNPNDFNIL